MRMAAETQRHRVLLPEPVGERAKRRLMAPLPVANWRDALAVVASLSLSAVELEADWLLTLDRHEAEGAFATAAVRPVTLHATVDRVLEAGPEPMQRWVELGVRYWMVEGLQGSEEELHELDGLAAEVGVTALLTNHAAGWFDGPALGRVASDSRRPHLGACYDPAAAVVRRRHPFLADMMAGPLKRAVRIVRLRDALFQDGSEVLPDRGNAELREVISALEARSYSGWYALSVFGTGPYRDRLAAVHASVTAMLDEL